MRFFKMHGLGNDFILVDGIKEKMPEDCAQEAVILCDRHFGVGADGLILILPSEKADIRMRIINSDGSEAEMCGNGIRCFARLVYELGYIKKEQFAVETKAGIMTPQLQLKNGKVEAVTVDMGEPGLERADIPMLGPAGRVIAENLEALDKTFQVTSLLMGVPHTVIFVDDAASFDLYKYGPAIEKNPVFPRKTNVNFIQVLNRGEIKHRVWERGAGPTLACGTGACASLVAAALNGKTDRRAKVHLPAGALDIEWSPSDNRVKMTGPAELTFIGETMGLFP